MQISGTKVFGGFTRLHLNLVTERAVFPRTNKTWLYDLCRLYRTGYGSSSSRGTGQGWTRPGRGGTLSLGHHCPCHCCWIHQVTLQLLQPPACLRRCYMCPYLLLPSYPHFECPSLGLPEDPGTLQRDCPDYLYLCHRVLHFSWVSFG